MFLAVLGLLVSSCGGGSSSGGGGGKQEFTGVTFASKTVTFDGEMHQLDEVSGNIPENTNISYQGR